MNTKSTQPSPINSTEQPWWNKPLWGKDSLFEGKNKEKLPVPPEVINHYKELWEILKFMIMVCKSLDSPQFKDPSFKQFIQVKIAFNREEGDYQGLKHSMILLRVAIEAKELFLSLESTEMRYRSKAQQDLYQNVFELLEQKVKPVEFKERVHYKLDKVLPEIKTLEGQEALKSYVEILDRLSSEDAIGLKLLYLFKKFQFNEFSILKMISDILDNFSHEKFQDINFLALRINENYKGFDKLSRFIELPAYKKNIQSYVLMLNYLFLRQKYQESYLQFQRLIEMLINEHKTYQSILKIRAEYPTSDYQMIPELAQGMPPESLYSKYQTEINLFILQKTIIQEV